ncbi:MULTISPECIES: DUF2062 domain-containing protein [Carboxydocella]|uniref:DUF2062 domain-containing protein n=2 Tax=Carboxydocella TaxID=178898 RepID=A0A1T4RH07_9FIRM|nr:MULTISPECIES: DUF2062 domain-containing protein [Carboxydocella]AVX19526.1 hypothetical protein CFE_0327 [Carboxydocella thermautotrophica]GAW29401.1 hypothetical protein ULO1_19710 [Carboxydocella sp. ULO1]GAW30955.1 hypothetical protein JDF658_07200 [Carboxydocella sp. JDF658]SKA15282.1 hypothetical protein SAMN02745885_02122 [Carboxydocella sporoproducens DSM 16521]
MRLGRRIRLFLLLFFRIKDMPAKVALGFAVGSCVNFYPTFGVGVPIALAAARLARGNVFAGLLGDLLFKPLFPFFFYLDLLVGNSLFGEKQAAISQQLLGLVKMEWQAFVQVGKAFFLGALVNSLLLGLILFLVVWRTFARLQPWCLNRLRHSRRKEVSDAH